MRCQSLLGSSIATKAPVRAITTAFLLIAAALPVTVKAAPVEPPSVVLTGVAAVEGRPVDLAWRPGDAALYIVSQEGLITRILDGLVTVVLDVTDLTAANGEMGLLGLAFSPSGDHAYINYNSPDYNTHVAEFAVNAAGVFAKESIRELIEVEQPYTNHKGGDLAFGPDGMLYIGMGDGGSAGDPDRRAQNLASLLGKLLRIDPAPSGELQYTIPADKPFVGQEGILPEIWAVGFRNPWRFSFDPETGDLWIADVGQKGAEEVNYAPADGNGVNAGFGLNFGWSGYEGTAVYNPDQVVLGHYPPIYAYPHGGRCAISGGVRARGEGAGALVGWYLFADYCSGEIFALPVTSEGNDLAAAGEAVVVAKSSGVTAVSAGPTGEVYVLGDLGIQRIDPA
jgi:glucose/arabinose dehydrogenase